MTDGRSGCDVPGQCRKIPWTADGVPGKTDLPTVPDFPEMGSFGGILVDKLGNFSFKL